MYILYQKVIFGIFFFFADIVFRFFDLFYGNRQNI